MQRAVLFLWNTSWNCVLLFDTQSFMCFTQQTARRVSTTSVSRVPESRNLKCRHRAMRSELQQSACVQNFGVDWRQTAQPNLPSVCSRRSSPSTNAPHILSSTSTRSFKMLAEKLRTQTSQKIPYVNNLKSCTRNYETSLFACPWERSVSQDVLPEAGCLRCKAAVTVDTIKRTTCFIIHTQCDKWCRQMEHF